MLLRQVEDLVVQVSIDFTRQPNPHPLRKVNMRFQIAIFYQDYSRQARLFIQGRFENGLDGILNFEAGCHSLADEQVGDLTYPAALLS